MLDHPMRGCKCDAHERERQYARNYSQRMNGGTGEQVAGRTRAHDGSKPVGLACDNKGCRKSEAECAKGGYHCCHMCTHTFDGGETTRTICECGQIVEKRRGRPKYHSCLGKQRTGVPVAV